MNWLKQDCRVGMHIRHVVGRSPLIVVHLWEVWSQRSSTSTAVRWLHFFWPSVWLAPSRCEEAVLPPLHDAFRHQYPRLMMWQRRAEGRVTSSLPCLRSPSRPLHVLLRINQRTLVWRLLIRAYSRFLRVWYAIPRIMLIMDGDLPFILEVNSRLHIRQKT